MGLVHIFLLGNIKDSVHQLDTVVYDRHLALLFLFLVRLIQNAHAVHRVVRIVYVDYVFVG